MIDVVMPKLGLTMASGTIARWIKRPGDAVREGEPLLEVSTDKISYEVEAPASGTLANAMGNEGDEFACGAVIASIAPANGAAAEPVRADAPVAAAPAAAPLPVSTAPDVAGAGANRVVEAPRISAAANGVAPTPTSATANGAPANDAPLHDAPSDDEVRGARVVASPAARRLARERGVRLEGVRGTGPRGRITLSDVPEREAGSRALRQAQGDTGSSARPPRLPAARRAIFDKMTAVGVIPIPQVEHVARVDALHALIERRGDFGWTAFAVFAVARLLRDHPDIRTDASSGAPFERFDIGFACDTAHGLIVPVVRDAAARSLVEVQREIGRLSARARDGALTQADVGGACFSISNVGPQGIERVAPLPDPPQTAILGIGAATQRAAVVDGAVRPARMLTCVLSFDHRFVDGAPAARFLAALAGALEHPGVFL